MLNPMDIDEFDFDLPPDLIAQQPSPERDKSRLLVVDRADASIRHQLFDDIVSYLSPADTLVVNQTKVIKARLRGVRTDTSSQVELLLIRPIDGGCWLAMGRPARRLKPGTQVSITGGGRVDVMEKLENGRLVVRLIEEDGASLLERSGETPLPPYIKRRPTPADEDRYQTVFARSEGAIAAPTAGLHFTKALLHRIRTTGVAVTPLTLHVGPGTFETIRCTDPRDHTLEAEYYELEPADADLIVERRERSGRTVAVGTTSVRALETCADNNGNVRAGSGWTEKFIYPPYEFAAVDAMVTNFHLPRSTLLMLVSAFAGRDLILDSYRTAVEAGYRFYSYGDAMLIL
jgi:S-adenosylmethionine:tRNA ribosyltransferase-isomerase